MSNSLGELRRSGVVSVFGPGAIVDFRADRATISAVAAGLEEWDRSFPPAGLANAQTIREERLQRKLGVQGFRLPPVAEERTRKDQPPDNRTLVAARFPDWLQCTSCNRIAPSSKWGRDPGRAARYCNACTQKAPGRRQVYAVPVRFVLACPKGHLDDFPWDWWVGHHDGCPGPRGDFLQLRSERAGHAGLILSCPRCKARRSMDGVFSSQTWERFGSCSGKRPWLAGGGEKCDVKPQAAQRGASNLYFPVIESALSIPPWSDRLQEVLGPYFDDIVDTMPEDRVAFVKLLSRNTLAPALKELGLSPEELVEQVTARIEHWENTSLNLKEEEYRQFRSAQNSKVPDKEFELRTVKVPEALTPWIASIAKVVRLREVRALRGFTRINPPGDIEDGEVARLSKRELNWLPAIEVRGEGIFLSFNLEALHRWEEQPDVCDRARSIDSAWRIQWADRYGPDEEPPHEITPRMLLVHTFAHALMRQLTLECGYSTTSLRERIYAQSGELEMAGLLIYTATSDADGTLGGLARQADPVRIEKTVISAIRSMEWCSSDPLCIEDLLTRPDAFLLAACHACVLAPETSCEEFNRFLDRALLVGRPNKAGTGFFAGLLDHA